MPITSSADLVGSLTELQILGPERLKKLQRALQGRAPEARVLARELVKQGWLTTFQANLLLQGRGAELMLGPYQLLDLLGEGGMGQVFKARHQVMDRVVVVKVIRKERLADKDAVQRFHREIRLAAQLDHPNLVRAHDAAQVGDTHFLVMEYAEGTDLHNLVQKAGPLPVGQACTYIRQAALGLQHAAERGMVHRDIKPSNLQVTGQGTLLKILDMGLARSMEPEGGERGRAELTQARTIMGTPDYISPEQIADARQVDIRADIYSLGCTLYFLLAGRPPFPVEAWEEKLVCHRRVEPQALEQVRPEVPPALGAVVRKMMAKRPEDRYANPLAVADALSPFCRMVGAVAVAAVAAPPALPTTSAASPATATPMPPLSSPGSLVNPSAAYEPGWTLNADSTLSQQPAPSTQAAPPALLSEPTMLVAGPHSAPPLPVAAAGPLPAAPKHLWLLVAGGGAIVGLLILVVVLVLSRGGDKDRPADDRRAEGSTSPSAGDKDTPPDDQRREPPYSPPGIGKGREPIRPPASGGPGIVSSAPPQPLPPPPTPSPRPPAAGGPGLGEGPEVPVAMTGHDSRAGLVCASLAFLPDGTHAVSSYGGKIYLWDLQKRVRQDSWDQTDGPSRGGFGPPGGALAGVVLVSPAGDLLAAGSAADFSGAKAVLLFDAATHARKGKIPVDQGSALAFAPDGSRLAGAEMGKAKGNRVRIIDLQTFQETEVPSGPPVCSLAFSPDGRFLATGHGDPRRHGAQGETGLRLWDLGDGSQKRVFEGHTGAVTHVGFSADGMRLFSASIPEGTLCVWNNPSDKEVITGPLKKMELGRSPGRMPRMVCATFWPHGRALTGQSDGSVKLWDLNAGIEMVEFSLRPAQARTAVTAVAISSDGRHGLAALADGVVYLFRLPSAAQPRAPKPPVPGPPGVRPVTPPTRPAPGRPRPIVPGAPGKS
jgi:serine/threonine-protein kinase